MPELFKVETEEAPGAKAGAGLGRLKWAKPVPGGRGGPGPWDDLWAVGGASGGEMNILTPDEKASRMEMYNKGMTAAEIAAKCFVCSAAVFKRRKEV